MNKFFSLDSLLNYVSNDMFPCWNLISLREMIGRTLKNCGMWNIQKHSPRGILFLEILQNSEENTCARIFF